MYIGLIIRLVNDNIVNIILIVVKIFYGEDKKILRENLEDISMYKIKLLFIYRVI